MNRIWTHYFDWKAISVEAIEEFIETFISAGLHAYNYETGSDSYFVIVSTGKLTEDEQTALFEKGD